MDIKTIGKLLASIVQEQLGITAYIANPNTARPDVLSLCSVRYFSSDAVGLDASEYLELVDPTYDLTERLTGMRELTYTLNFQKDNSSQNASQLRQSLRKSSVREKLILEDVVYVSSTNPVNGTEPVGDEFEERASMDVVVRTIMTTEDVINSIQELNITLDARFSQNIESIIEVKHNG